MYENLQQTKDPNRKMRTHLVEKKVEGKSVYDQRQAQSEAFRSEMMGFHSTITTGERIKQSQMKDVDLFLSLKPLKHDFQYDKSVLFQGFKTTEGGGRGAKLLRRSIIGCQNNFEEKMKENVHRKINQFEMRHKNMMKRNTVNRFSSMKEQPFMR